MPNSSFPDRRNLLFSVCVAALGYFVDLYDIVIFGVVRVTSLNELGIHGTANTDWGIRLLNLQMGGMLIGGLFWGVIGDRLGRRFALLCTIALYSLANVANAAVGSVEQYAWLRFIAGFGLAGELGAGVALVAELLPAQRRGYGTTAIAVLGLVGALSASYVGANLPWRSAYLVGGVTGLLVLAGRFLGLRESELFTSQRLRGVVLGDLRLLFFSGRRLLRFAAVIAVGVPIWYVSALFVNFAPELGRAASMQGALSVAEVLRWQAFGLALGSGISGLLSEQLHSRRRVILLGLAVMAALTLILLWTSNPTLYTGLMFAMGLAQGYWTVFLTLSAEQFGTNLRATVSTSVPNFVRAATVPVTLSVEALSPSVGWITATLIVGIVTYGLAGLALAWLRETHGENLDYSES